MLYVIVVTIILFLFFLKMPKVIKSNDIFIIWLIVSYVELVADLYLAQVLGLYYFSSEPSVSPEALTVKLIMGPLFGIIFINYMPQKFSSFIPYWLFWTAFSTFFEWTTYLSGYLTYTGWKLWMSAVFFFIIIPITRWGYYYIKH